MLILTGEGHLHWLAPTRLRIRLEELKQCASWLQVGELLATLGDHHCDCDSAQVPLIDGVDSPLHGPEPDGFEHHLECVLVRHIIDHVLTGDASEQTALSSLTQFFKHVSVRQIGLFQHLEDAFGFINASEKYIELNLSLVHLDDGNFCL